VQARHPHCSADPFAIEEAGSTRSQSVSEPLCWPATRNSFTRELKIVTCLAIGTKGHVFCWLGEPHKP
jgi:hypothetical protein